jgi:hypothetical protein
LDFRGKDAEHEIMLSRPKAYRFRPVSLADLPRLRAWGDPAEQLELIREDLKALRKPNLVESDMWGVSPIDQMICRINFKRARYDGPYHRSARLARQKGGFRGGQVNYDFKFGRLVVVITQLHLLFEKMQRGIPRTVPAAVTAITDLRFCRLGRFVCRARDPTGCRSQSPPGSSTQRNRPLCDRHQRPQG